MKFTDLDSRMRIFETTNDRCILPGIYIVARLDGKGFTKLTKEIMQCEAPFDSDFKCIMIETTKHLVKNSGFNIIYGYTQSDEISLLFALNDDTFNRKTRKINSILAGLASSAFTLLTKMIVCFDCRVCELPTVQNVIDYFRWRQEDACRNALNSYCYWTLRKEGQSVGQATSALKNKGVPYKNELLFQKGINFNDAPAWQKRGIGMSWQNIEKAGYNPIKQEGVKVLRRKLCIDDSLPLKEEYDVYISKIISDQKTDESILTCC